jgi:hypothetical protein
MQSMNSQRMAVCDTSVVDFLNPAAFRGLQHSAQGLLQSPAEFSTPLGFIVEFPAELRSYLAAQKDIGKLFSLKNITQKLFQIGSCWVLHELARRYIATIAVNPSFGSCHRTMIHVIERGSLRKERNRIAETSRFRGETRRYLNKRGQHSRICQVAARETEACILYAITCKITPCQ